MAKISIEPAKVKATLSQQDALEKLMRSLAQNAGSVRGGLRMRISGREAINARLRDAENQLRHEADSVRNIRNGLEQIIAKYEQTENKNRDSLTAEKTTIQQQANSAPPSSGSGTETAEGDTSRNPSDWSNLIIKDIMDLINRLIPVPPFPSGISVLPWVTPLLPGIIGLTGLIPGCSPGGLLGSLVTSLVTNPSQPSIRDYLKEVASGKIGGAVSSLGIDKNVSDFSDAHTKDLGNGKYYWDPSTGKTVAVDPNDPKAIEEFNAHNKNKLPVDVKLASIGTSGSISAFDLEGAISGDVGGLNYTVSGPQLSGNASLYAGILGVGAEAGFGFSAFSAEESGYLGSDSLQVYEKVSVEAGRVGANGKVSVGLVDKDGNFNPSVYAGGSLEAIAGEISGSVGVKALGTDIGVEGSLNYGIGAHANVGFHDGKVSLDIGASVGVGASVKLDIDVSGTIDAVCDAAGNIFSGVKNLFGF